MYNEQIENLVKAALTDGVLTEKEKQILFKKAESMGIDLDEFEMVLDARLVELQKAEKEKAEKSAPKSNKYGDVRKCPSCGAIVPALAGSCPECGYEFSGIDANLSSQKLSDLLLKADDEYNERLSKIGGCNILDTEIKKEELAKAYQQKKEQIIRSFPIPSTKSDLFEFITSLKPKTSGINDGYSDAYFEKYLECIDKARVMFPEDKKLMLLVDEGDKYRKERKFTRLKFILGIVGLFVLLMVFMGVMIYLEEKNVI